MLSLGERVANRSVWVIRELGLRSRKISVMKMSRNALKNVLKYKWANFGV